LEPRPNFRQRERQGVRRQEQILGVRKLGTPSPLVLYDGAPQVDLTVDSVLLISRAEMVERFGGVDAAGAIHLRGIVGIMAFDATSDGSDDSRSPASRRQRLVRMLSLPAE
jgi:hypothetical protein